MEYREVIRHALESARKIVHQAKLIPNQGDLFEEDCEATLDAIEVALELMTMLPTHE